MALDICPSAGPFGAAISGINLADELPADVRERVGDAFAEHSVVCFKQQQFASPDEFLFAASQLGDPMAPVTATYRLPGYEVIEELRGDAVDKRADNAQLLKRGGSWHTDHSNLAVPPKATVLYAIEVPEVGGNTEFTHLQLAYEALTTVQKDELRGLRVFEAYLSRRAPRKLLTRTSAESADSSGVWQPLVRRHPESGRAGLYMNPMRDDAVEGLSQTEGDILLDKLYAHCEQERFRYAHRWTQGDVLMWDNRCVWHRACFDFDISKRRYLHRIMLQGDLPRAG